MIPYILLLEELLRLELGRAVSTWNQASIGAGVGRGILRDKLLRSADNGPLIFEAHSIVSFPL
jgi:hypothetical protein